MDRKPVIFLSSTYIDLKKARSMVIGHLIKNQFLFSGMEGFFMLPMMEQWENIKRTIDDCDIYVTILGDRFGSLAHEGKSCTESGVCKNCYTDYFKLKAKGIINAKES